MVLFTPETAREPDQNDPRTQKPLKYWEFLNGR